MTKTTSIARTQVAAFPGQLPLTEPRSAGARTAESGRTEVSELAEKAVWCCPTLAKAAQQRAHSKTLSRDSYALGSWSQTANRNGRPSGPRPPYA
jgi:hypothetical protein